MTQFSGIKAGGKTYDIWATKAEVEALNNQGNAGLASEVTAGKTAIANAIVAKGGTAQSSQSFNELATDITNIPNYQNYLKLAMVLMSAVASDSQTGHQQNVNADVTEINDTLGLVIEVAASKFQYWDLITKINLSACITVNQSAFSMMSGLKEVYLPNAEIFKGGTFNIVSPLTSQLIKVNMIKFNSTTSTQITQTFRGCNNLIDLTIGENINSNVSFSSMYYTVANAILNTSSSLCFGTDQAEYGRTFNNNREKWNYCLREHFASNLADRTGLTAYTITFGSTIINAMEQATIEAFTNKNWTLA